MFSSVKKRNEQLVFSQVKQKSQFKSIQKSEKSLSSKRSFNDGSKNQKQIRNLMTSNAYNNVFCRLTNLENLKQFVRQSSQYVQFHQQLVKGYIPEGHADRRRFSFSLKSSIYSFLARDYRFLWHYFTLLRKQFPDQKKKIKEELYDEYKEIVVDQKKFKNYFYPHKNANKFDKQTQKSIKSVKILANLRQSVRKQTNQKQTSSNKRSMQKSKTLRSKGENSVQRSKLQTKFEQRHQNSNINNKSLNNKSQKRVLIKQSKIKKTELFSDCKNSKANFQNSQKQSLAKQNDLGLSNKGPSRKRRSTQQNILLIQEALTEIENLCNKSFSKSQISEQPSENALPYTNPHLAAQSIKSQECNQNQAKYQKLETLVTCSEEKQNKQGEDVLKSKKVHDQQIQQFENQQMENMYRTRSRMKKSRKKIQESQSQQERRLLGLEDSKKKTTKRKQRQVSFKQIFDIDDPKNKELIETVHSIQLQLEKKNANQTAQNQIFEVIRKSVLSRRQWIKKDFDQKQKSILRRQIKSVQKLIQLFGEIKFIGNLKQFTIDRNSSLYIDLGQIDGFKVQQVLTWPTESEQWQQVYKGLYLTKLAAKQQQQQSGKIKVQIQLEQLKQRLALNEVQGVSLLLIEK